MLMVMVAVGTCALQLECHEHRPNVIISATHTIIMHCKNTIVSLQMASHVYACVLAQLMVQCMQHMSNQPCMANA